jgi:hypothetical protein
MIARSKIMRGMALGALAGLLTVGAANALDVGQKAPEFTLTGPGNKQVRLADLVGKGPVVIYTFIHALAAA